MTKDTPQTNPMPPAAPPPAIQSVQPVAPSSTPPNSTEVLGIISLVLAFMGIALVGLIVGLVGTSKAKKAGRSPVLPRIGWIINAVFMAIVVLIVGLVFAATPFLGRSTRDLDRRNDMLFYQSTLEIYYNQNGYYPNKLTIVPPSSPRLTLNDFDYHALPEGCDKCKSFILKTELENVQDGSKVLELKSRNGQPEKHQTSEI